MPAVKLRSADNKIEPAQTRFDIRMLKKAIDTIKNKIPSFRLGTMMQSVTPSELWKPSIYSISDISENTIGNLKFSTPNNYPYLLDTPFPAISVYDLRLYYEHGIFPQWNKDVLYIKVLSTEERESLKSVLGKYELP